MEFGGNYPPDYTTTTPVLVWFFPSVSLLFTLLPPFHSDRSRATHVDHLRRALSGETASGSLPTASGSPPNGKGRNHHAWLAQQAGAWRPWPERPPRMARPPWPSPMHPLLRWRKMKGQGVSETKGEKQLPLMVCCWATIGWLLGRPADPPWSSPKHFSKK